MTFLDVSVIKHVASPRHRKVHLRSEPGEVLASIVVEAAAAVTLVGWVIVDLMKDTHSVPATDDIAQLSSEDYRPTAGMRASGR